MFSVLFVSIVILYGLIHLGWKLWTRKLAFLPNMKNVPIFGSVPFLNRDAHKVLIQVRDLAISNDNLLVVWLGHMPLILSGTIEFSQAILSSNEVLKKSSMYRYLGSWLGTGLLTSYGDKWKSRRKVITPAFHFSILNDFASIFEDNAKILVENLRIVADSGNAIDIQKPVGLCVLDVICETAMGVRVCAQQETHSNYVKSVFSLTEHVHLRMRSPWLYPDFIYQMTTTGRSYFKALNVVHSFAEGVINKRIEIRKGMKQESEICKLAFLDMLLDAYDKGEIDVAGIREEVDTFMFEGHDTTTSGLSFTLFLLGLYPEVQEKLQKEIDAISDNSSSIIDKVRELKYLEYVVKESLRLCPPVPIFARYLEEDFVVNGNVIPRGTEVGIASALLHRNPKYWDDPDLFNPDRFANERLSKRNPYLYIPFSAGSRNCIGQRFALLEMKTIMYYIMLNYSVKCVQTVEEIEVCAEIVSRSRNGLLLTIISRV